MKLSYELKFMLKILLKELEHFELQTRKFSNTATKKLKNIVSSFLGTEEEKNQQETFKILLALYGEASEHKDQIAYLLSTCYLAGLGVERNPDKAFYYSKVAADLNYASGLYNLSFCYHIGIGVTVDNKISREFLTRSATTGETFSPFALYSLGYSADMSSDVIQVKKDLAREKAELYSTSNAERGHSGKVESELSPFKDVSPTFLPLAKIKGRMDIEFPISASDGRAYVDLSRAGMDSSTNASSLSSSNGASSIPSVPIIGSSSPDTSSNASSLCSSHCHDSQSVKPVS